MTMVRSRVKANNKNMEKPKFEIPAAPEQDKEGRGEYKNKQAETAEKTYENKEGLTVKEFEYRDEEGELIGMAIIKLQEQSAGANESENKFYRLLDFHLTGRKDGKDTEIDVLSLIDLKNTKVHIPREGVAFCYDAENDIAIVPLPETPIQTAIMLHELGHAKQLQDEAYKNIGELGVWLPIFQDMPDVPEKIRKIKSSVDNLDEKTIKLLNELEQLAEKILSEKLDQSSSVVQEYFKLWMDYQKDFVQSNPDEQILERDATKRALQWMRQIRNQSGVDLFKDLQKSTVSEVIEKNYQGREEELEAGKIMYENCGNAQKFLQTSLKTYQADTKQMREQHGGNIPKVKK